LMRKKPSYGQNMTARYHETDTWLRRKGERRIIAGHAFRYYEDPSLGRSADIYYRDYVGTVMGFGLESIDVIY
jgi:hypothetical protein